MPDTVDENKVEERMKLPDDFQINYPYDHEPNYPNEVNGIKVEERMKLPDDFQINYPYDHEPNYPNEVEGLKLDEGWGDYIAKHGEKAAKEAVKNGKETSFVAAGNGKEKELTIGKFFKNLKKCDKIRNKQAAKTKKAFEKVEKKKEKKGGKQNHF